MELHTTDPSQNKSEMWWNHHKIEVNCGGITTTKGSNVVVPPQNRGEMWWNHHKIGVNCGVTTTTKG